MITGIDETGDFDPKSTFNNFFIAVHLDQNSNKLEVKKSQFDDWENSIPYKYLLSNEVKGHNLPDAYINSFYEEVLEVEPRVLYSVIRINPSENPVEIVNKHKQFEIKEFEKVIKQATEAGHMRWVEGYNQILYWYKNRNYQTLLKMKCLEHLLGISLNRVFGWAQLTYMLDNNDIKNLRDITFKIDKDFVKAENVKILWNELLRQFWLQYTKSTPLPVVVAWKKADHPFLKLYGTIDGKTNLTRIFRKNTQFLDSKNSWEIRMADLLGTILHRYQNYDRCNDVGFKLMKHLGKRQKNYEHLILNDVFN